MEVLVTKRITFDASHYLNVPSWNKEQNIKAFHKCSKYKPDGQEEPHGHTYILEVSVAGEVDPETGFVIDFKELKKILKEKVTDLLDHRLLNNVEYFKDKNTTVENLIRFIWDTLYYEITAPGRKLYQLKLHETPDSWAIYDGNLSPGEYCDD